MKPRYIAVAVLAFIALVCLAATTVERGLPISQYPNNGFPNSNALFVMARPGVTNENISFGQLAFRVTNGFASGASTNYVNNLTTVVSNGVLVFVTNFVNTTSNSLFGLSSSNGSNLVVLGGTNILVSKTSTNGTNFYIVNADSFAITNGLASTNFVIGNGNSVSNGLLTIINLTSNFLFTSSSLTGTTNFMNLSVQAAKLPATNYPSIDGGNQNWEVIYYHTNAENAVANLSAAWQFVVPPDYATNTGKLHVQHTLIATNGPNSSNVVFTVDCVRSHSGDNVNLHTAAFGVQVSGTNTWAQSSTIVNAQTDLVINLNTNLMWQAGDLVVMRLTRNLTNDTYRNTAVGLVGLQLEYTRQ